jgi:hypothetical protein
VVFNFFQFGKNTRRLINVSVLGLVGMGVELVEEWPMSRGFSARVASTKIVHAWDFNIRQLHARLCPTLPT